MSDERCAPWRGAIAMHALGALSDHERAGLLAHLDGCPACREESAELASTVAALALVDRTVLTPTASVSPELASRVLGGLHDAAATETRHRRRRRAGVTVAALAIAASIVAAVVLSLPSASSRPPARTVALSGSGSVLASAALVPHDWGTSVTITERGLPGGNVYTVSMLTSHGSWWTTGSYRGVTGRVVVAHLSCAVPLGEITGVRVTNAAGSDVLWSSSAAAHWRLRA